MKCKYILWFTILFYSASIYAQWSNQNPVPDGNHLFSTFFVDDNNGWIVGSGGFIKKTTNAGLDWVQQNSGTTVTLKSVQFINQNTGWICGEEGLIIKTTNGGQSWFGLTSGTTETLTDLQFCNLNIGYVVGNNETILKTTDGGLSWITQQSGISYDLFSVDFVDALLGYAVGGKDSSNFLKTTDGGLSWSKRTLNLGALNNPILNCVEFIDANVGWIGSESLLLNHSGQISKTNDGGETWFSTVLYGPMSRQDSTLHTQEDNPLDNQRGIRAIYFKDSNNGYAVGGTIDGWWRKIFTTTDGGTSWQSKYGYSEQTGLLSVFLNSSGQGWAVGYYGVMYKTDDYGVSWYQILSGKQYGYNGDWITTVFMINDSVGWAGGYRKGIWYYPILLKTTNGGKIWKTSSEFNDNFSPTKAHIFFISENIGWVSFSDIGTYKTTDGGVNWLPSGNAGIEKFFINQDTGWATNAPWGVYKSTNGGTNWVQKCSISSRSVHFSDSNNGWAVGAGGSILKSNDGGESWISKISGTTSILNSVRFYDSNIGMCVGNSGTVLLSTDGGENWISQNVGTTATLNSVVLTNATSAWIAGSGGLLLNTTDSGNSWISYGGMTQSNLTSLQFLDENTGWVSGGNDIFKYQNDIIPVELLSFAANVKNNKVLLSWQTATEINNFGFEIERKIDDEDWNKLGFIEGHGHSTLPNSYSFTDINFLGGIKYQYRLRQIDLNGNFEYSNEIEVEIIPNKYELSQNYPNPFNPSTMIRFSLPQTSQIKINVYNMIGEHIATLAEGTYESGYHKVIFNASNLASGAYIYRIESSNPSTGSGQGFVQVKKMILLR